MPSDRIPLGEARRISRWGAGGDGRQEAGFHVCHLLTFLSNAEFKLTGRNLNIRFIILRWKFQLNISLQSGCSEYFLSVRKTAGFPEL